MGSWSALPLGSGHLASPRPVGSRPRLRKSPTSGKPRLFSYQEDLLFTNLLMKGTQNQLRVGNFMCPSEKIAPQPTESGQRAVQRFTARSARRMCAEPTPAARAGVSRQWGMASLVSCCSDWLVTWRLTQNSKATSLTPALPLNKSGAVEHYT